MHGTFLNIAFTFFVALGFTAHVCAAEGVASAASSQAHELLVGIYNNPPHMIVDPDGVKPPTGAVVDFFNNYINPKNEYSVKWVSLPFLRFLEDAGNKKFDLGFMVAKTSDRLKVMRYASSGLAKTHSVLVVLKDSKIKEVKSVTELKGLRIGYSFNNWLPLEMIDAGVKFDAMAGRDNFERNFERLRLKKIDGIFIAAGSAAKFVLRKADPKNELRIVKLPVELDLYPVFRKDVDPILYDKINKLIEKNRANYPALLSKYKEETKAP